VSDTVTTDGTAQYLYCLVPASDDGTLDVCGIDDAPVSVVTVDGVGAVTSPTPARIETDSELAVKRLLVAHQRVVDAAMDRYGTPLPIQATTAIDGDERALREWLADRAGVIREELASLAGDREYHVTVTWDEDAAADAAHDADDRLDELEAAVETAGPGESYLREKQYERALGEAIAGVESELASETRARVERVAHAVVDRPATSGVSFAPEHSDSVVRLAVRAALENEDALGAALDAIADREGVTVRFTGPWAPYSFAPELGGDE